MRLVRYIVILLILLVGVYSFAWYYIANKITTQINNNYANKNFPLSGINHEELFVSFSNATIKGFPLEMIVNLNGFHEESKGALITYNSPVNIGYNLISQNAYISYNGRIDAAYKPVERGFGAILKIKDYLIKLSVPLNRKLIKTLSDLKDPIEIINYVGDLNISTKGVQIFDKQEKKLFYDKDHERLKFSFVPKKHYLNLEDLLNNIPQQYNIYYLVKTNPVNEVSRKIPVSLFYGFSMLPPEFDATAEMSITTKASKIKDLSENVDIKAQFSAHGAKINIPDLKLNLIGGINPAQSRNTKLLVDGKIRIKEGLFDSLFAKYESIKSNIASIPGGPIINQEMSYIIANKEAFRFKDLENSDYDLNVDVASETNQNKTSMALQVNNFSIYSGDSGFKLTNDSVLKMGGKDWHSKGVLLIKNYPAVIEFSSGYIYRFGKFRLFNDQARNLYVKVNKEFFKEISDYPKSTSNDLSFEYEADSKNIINAKLGSVKISQIPELYTLMLYNKLFGSVDPHGDVLNQMKKILPDLNENDPILKKILPSVMNKELDKLSTLKPKDIKNSVEKLLQIK